MNKIKSLFLVRKKHGYLYSNFDLLYEIPLWVGLNNLDLKNHLLLYCSLLRFPVKEEDFEVVIWAVEW
ncbi:hypothetical protein [Nonlabens dokdonensis]|uniref:Uncharacterized protein n=1 Tax=Nonlabens dokdonensis (strain DSM 17205 / KCTC 12402 / DSW-6) TaxID=592029 RepID=L7W8K5_NONDD|nr:hypothetical protein [Nonlabens dokdonensis]AGC78030.1 hypothetical protein DDD_2903 [Nonlabens dokdonensis DSW-6]